MILQEVAGVIAAAGYQRVALNHPSMLLFGTREQNQSKYIVVVYAGFGKEQDVAAVKGQMWQLTYNLRQSDPFSSLLFIVVTPDIASYRVLNEMEDTVWYVDEQTSRLIIYENQNDGNKELRDQLEQVLIQYVQNQGEHRRRQAAEKEYLPVISITIAVINLAIYMIMYHGIGWADCEEVIGALGLRWDRVVYQHEYYRAFTCMFLHSDLVHVFNNMLTLICVGKLLEPIMSKARYIVIYVCSGLAGSLLSMGYHMYTGERALSIGASGAVFGMIGAMICCAFVYRGRFIRFSPIQIVVFLALTISTGTAGERIDNAAHLGGLLAGSILAGILMHRRNLKEREE